MMTATSAAYIFIYLHIKKTLHHVNEAMLL